MLLILQILLLAAKYSVLPTLPWWVVLMPLCVSLLGALIVVLLTICGLKIEKITGKTND